MNTSSVRTRVLDGLLEVSQQGRSAQEVLPGFLDLPEADRRLAFELFYGSLHHYFELQAAVKNRLQRPLKRNDSDLRILMILGMYQLSYTRIAEHAALNETVELCHHLQKPWATKLVNAILRRYQRDKQNEKTDKLSPADKANFPNWLHAQLSEDWAAEAAEIFTESHTRAPLTIRINRRKTTPEQYKQALIEQDITFIEHPQHSHALSLERVGDITRLPGYAEGWFSVQDGAAQFAAAIIDPQTDEKILDACAAPGGKTSHLMELADCNVIAVDNIATRLERMQENLQRLGLQADVRLGDALLPDEWLTEDEKQFDKILLDAPCSATGIIRRHPDIALHRRGKDIRSLTQLQWRLLKTMWGLLKPGGTLVYSTCSILKAENEFMVADFLKQNADAELKAFNVGTKPTEKPGLWQILPGELRMDGFFYAKIQKQG